MSKKMNKVRVLLKILIILLLALAGIMRHSYYINPVPAEQPLLVAKSDYMEEEPDQKVHAIGGMAFTSMIVFYIIFGLINAMFGSIFLFTHRYKIMWMYGIMVVVSAMLFGVYKMTGLKWVFDAGSIVKNFVLSPVFTIIMYIFFKFPSKRKLLT